MLALLLVLSPLTLTALLMLPSSTAILSNTTLFFGCLRDCVLSSFIGGLGLGSSTAAAAVAAAAAIAATLPDSATPAAGPLRKTTRPAGRGSAASLSLCVCFCACVCFFVLVLVGGSEKEEEAAVKGWLGLGLSMCTGERMVDCSVVEHEPEKSITDSSRRRGAGRVGRTIEAWVVSVSVFVLVSVLLVSTVGGDVALGMVAEESGREGRAL